MGKQGIFFIVLLFVSLTLKAQKYRFLNYSVRQGLAQTQVTDIKQDKKGYLWVSTLNGLSRYDGSSFVNYFEKDGLISNKIKSLFIDEQDNVWVASTDGISVISGDKIEAFELNHLFESYKLSKVILHQDKIWISTKENGVYLIKRAKKDEEMKLIHHFQTEFRDIEIRDINVINSSLYVSTKKGVFVIKNEKVSEVKEFIGMSIICVEVNSLGELWASTENDGIYRLNKEGLVHINQGNSDLLNDFIDGMYIDKGDNVWICTDYDLSKIQSDLKVYNYYVTNGFDYIPEVTFEDSEGNIWIGTNGDGLVKFTNTEFQYLNDIEGFNTDLVISISEDKKGAIWLGTLGEGVGKIKDESVTLFNAKESSPYSSSLPSNNVWFTFMDMNEEQYFATSDGLAVFSKNDFWRYTKEYHGLPDDKVQSLYQESPGVLWIGTKKGVAYKKDGAITSIDSFPYTNVRSITSTQDGLYWFGTTQGLINYDGFKSEQINDSLLLNNTIYTIQSYGNKLWIGSQNGLIYYDGEEFEQFNFSQENYNSAINQLLVDRDNFLWIGTNRGVYTLDITKFNKGEKEITTYTTNNGLVGMETNLNAIFQDSQDRIWIGTNEGVNIFKRAERKNNIKFVPSIHLSNIKLFLKIKIGSGHYVQRIKRTLVIERIRLHFTTILTILKIQIQ